MGCCVSAELQAQERRSRQIEKNMDQERKKLIKECKILLLGGGESGKSTIVKQMKIIHQNGYTKEELTTYRPGIYKNIAEGAQSLVGAIKKFEIQWENPLCKEYAVNICAISLEADSAKISPEIGRQIQAIWQDAAAKQCLELHHQQFYLMDSASYLFDNVERICSPEYIPTEADVLRARIKTTGIAETRFTMGLLAIHMFDVGGQRSERKKWIHCFEGVTSIIFCVALSEYDQVLLEESTRNRMAESIQLFDAVINSRWFVRTSIILFLNKIDLFKAKLTKVPLQDYFPEYKGGDDVNKAAKFMLWRFQHLNRSRLNVYPHLTCATDTSQIRIVFAAVKETILQNALKDSGIL